MPKFKVLISEHVSHTFGSNRTKVHKVSQARESNKTEDYMTCSHIYERHELVISPTYAADHNERNFRHRSSIPQ